MIASTGVRRTRVSTRIGDLDCVLSGDAVTGIYFPGHWRKPERALVGEPAADDDQLAADLATQLRAWLDGERTDFDLPLAPEGTDLERRVWLRLLAIPYGETETYGAIATELGNPALAQEVGRIVGENPISIVIPCHRVVGASGGLTGYAGGLERKAYLLDLEAFLTGRTLLDPRAG